MASIKSDPTSLSNPLDVKVVSSHLALTVDFTNKILAGHVDHRTEVLKEGSSTLVLDSKALKIKNVSLVAQADEALEYKLGTPSEVFGVPLEITIPSSLRAAGSSFTARVHYETTNECSALQWLHPQQTAGKKHPYLFSQCQAIHARSMVPCQDTPSNKIKYTAAISVATPLTALMSATPTTSTKTDSSTTYNFVQDVPIPTYLIAIAAGNLESRDIGPRSKVWSEPEMVEKGAYEFANTEKFIKTGEDLLTPYVWGRYDILLLPPSFPYGGMENPQLTFVTPTLLAGDRSLENVVAHEIAHSWMGNLVTNRYWSEFFLNEGFTVFIERKILARLNNADFFDFEALGGLKHLQDDINHFGATNPLTALRPKMDGIDPDDAFSSVPYEKGFNLLCFLQSLVGAEKFEQWLKAYVTKFQYQSITADQMREFFLGYFKDVPDLDKKIDWDAWFDMPGMPLIDNKFNTKLADSAITLAKKWAEQGGQGTSADDLKEFSSGQKTTFLDQLLVLTESKPLSPQTIQAMDKLYNFTATKNSEIRLRWYTLCIKSGHTDIFPHVVNFLKEQGRMKFVRPLYRELHKHSEGKQLAESTFKANRESYHSIAARMIAKDLGVEN
jgi:leukotriene-A4 hydrolase